MPTPATATPTPTYSTGEVARICGVSLATVTRWIDRGDLKGFRIPTEREDRRVGQDELVAFMRAHKYPESRIPGVPAGVPATP